MNYIWNDPCAKYHSFIYVEVITTNTQQYAAKSATDYGIQVQGFNYVNYLSRIFRALQDVKRDNETQ